METKLIKVKIDTATYDRLVADRKAAGLPSVAALLLHNSEALNGNSLVTEALQRALRKAGRKVPGVRYRVNDLFTREEWQEMLVGTRLNLGKAFRAEIETDRYPVRFVEKNSANHTFYETLARSNATRPRGRR